MGNKITIIMNMTNCNIYTIDKHTLSSTIWEYISAVAKIVQGEAEYDFYVCMYTFSQNWRRMRVIAIY